MSEERRILDDGTIMWFMDGVLHHEDGPAVITDGSKYWYERGYRHRIDGPAIMFADGGRVWYLNGMTMSEEEHRTKSPYYTSFTDSERLFHRLKSEE